MKIVLCSIVFLAFVGCACAVNCETKPDGQYEMGCRSYAECRAGNLTIVNCDDGFVYNNKTERCENSTKVAPPCGTQIDCSSMRNGRYADMNYKCRAWYTCWYGEFFGHNFCSGGTVFDESAQACNWPGAVPPPCGLGLWSNA